MKNNILFIGAGNLGTTLASALSQSGFVIPLFYSKEFPDNRLEYLPNTDFINDLNAEHFNNIEIVIIAVQDDQILNVVHELDLLNVDWSNKLVIHTSGCLSSLELDALKSKDALVGSLHPMQTFDDCFLHKSIFNDIIFAVEGDNKIIVFAKKASDFLGAKVITLKPQDKILYHIAAVASSNFFVGLLDYVSQLYKNLDFDENKIKDLILPIINQTVSNFGKNDSKDILTGPLKRGDFNTIENHVEYLKDNQKELLPVYNEISKYISQFILKHNKSDQKKLNRILHND